MRLTDPYAGVMRAAGASPTNNMLQGLRPATGSAKNPSGLSTEDSQVHLQRTASVIIATTKRRSGRPPIAPKKKASTGEVSTETAGGY